MTTDASSAPRVGIQPPAFRLPDDVQVGAVKLQIADLDRSLAFYQEVIGLRAVARDDDPRARTATLSAHGDDSNLLVLREKRGIRPVPRGGLLGIYHFALLLPSRAGLGRFIRHAVELDVRIGGSHHGFSEGTYLVDPDGISIEVYADRPRST